MPLDAIPDVLDRWIKENRESKARGKASRFRCTTLEAVALGGKADAPARAALPIAWQHLTPSCWGFKAASARCRLGSRFGFEKHHDTLDDFLVRA